MLGLDLNDGAGGSTAGRTASNTSRSDSTHPGDDATNHCEVWSKRGDKGTAGSCSSTADTMSNAHHVQAVSGTINEEFKGLNERLTACANARLDMPEDDPP